jgi:hypothetical protein
LLEDAGVDAEVYGVGFAGVGFDGVVIGGYLRDRAEYAAATRREPSHTAAPSAGAASRPRALLCTRLLSVGRNQT